MDIEKYLVAYEVYRDTVLGMKKAMSRRRAGESDIDLPVGEMIDFLDYEDLEREYERKKHILSRATKRIQKAIAEISDTRLSNYLFCRYLCCMTNDEIANNFNYCQRQIYRIASSAKKELKKCLEPKMPRASRWCKGRRFTFKRHSHRRHHRKFGPRARRFRGYK